MYGDRPRLDPPGQRGRDREHHDAGEHRHGGGRVGVLGARDQRVPARVQRRGGEDDRERGEPVSRRAPRSAPRPTLPPEIVTPTRRPRASTLPASSAANALAPLGSATVLARSNRSRMASTISASETVTTSWTSSWITGNVSSPGIGSCWPSAIVRGTGDPDPLARGERAHEVVARLGLDADDPRVGRERRGRGRAAGEQAAAADAHEQHVQRARVLEQLERRRALAGHHALVVVGVDRDQASLAPRAPPAAPRGRRRSGRT